MNELTFPFATPELNQRCALLDGIDCVRLSVPWALNHVNCWCLLDEDGTTLIDTGINSRSTKAVWQALMAEGMPQRVLVTHYHPDHSGLAGWFHEQGVELIGHATEIALMNSIWSSEPENYVAGFAEWYARHGLLDEQIQPLKLIGHGYRSTVAPVPGLERWQTLDADDFITIGTRRFEILVGQGHAPAMLMLHCAAEKLLIVADQVLPKISPNVSVFPSAPEANPLATFLATLQALKSLPEDTLVLPSHGEPFLGLHTRIEQLQSHHEERLDELRKYCTGATQAADVFEILYSRKLDAQQLSFALGEAVAHLKYLVSLGELKETCGDSRTVFSPV